jgi:hypothetical protein
LTAQYLSIFNEHWSFNTGWLVLMMIQDVFPNEFWLSSLDLLVSARRRTWLEDFIENLGSSAATICLRKSYGTSLSLKAGFAKKYDACSSYPRLMISTQTSKRDNCERAGGENCLSLPSANRCGPYAFATSRPGKLDPF